MLYWYVITITVIVKYITLDAWGLEEQSYEYKTKPYEKDYGPFYRYDPDQCILCGRCVEACQDIEVNETISDWNREHPRVIWDNDVPINESSCVSWSMCNCMSL